MALTEAEIKRRVKALNKHYRKKLVSKDFGMHGVFEGRITDCWMTPSGREYAHIQYADGDEEDVSITKVQCLLVESLTPMLPSCPRRITRLAQAAATSHRSSNISCSDGNGQSNKGLKEDGEEAMQLEDDNEDEREVRSCVATAAGQEGGRAASSAPCPSAAAAGKTTASAPRATSAAGEKNAEADSGGVGTAAAAAAAAATTRTAASAVALPLLSPAIVNAESIKGTASIVETVAGEFRRTSSKEEKGKEDKVVVKEMEGAEETLSTEEGGKEDEVVVKEMEGAEDTLSTEEEGKEDEVVVKEMKGAEETLGMEEEGNEGNVVVKEMGAAEGLKAEKQQEAEKGIVLHEEGGGRKIPQLPSSTSTSNTTTSTSTITTTTTSTSSETKAADLVCWNDSLKPSSSTLNGYIVRSSFPSSRFSFLAPIVGKSEGGEGNGGESRGDAKIGAGDGGSGGGRQGGAGTARELAPFKHLVGSIVRKPGDDAGPVTGLVSKVWVGDPKGARRVLARIRYGNKHEEDLPIDDLLPLLKPKRSRR